MGIGTGRSRLSRLGPSGGRGRQVVGGGDPSDVVVVDPAGGDVTVGVVVVVVGAELFGFVVVEVDDFGTVDVDVDVGLGATVVVDGRVVGGTVVRAVVGTSTAGTVTRGGGAAGRTNT